MGCGTRSIKIWSSVIRVKPPVAPAGGSYDLALSWNGLLYDGDFTARLELINHNSKVGGACAGFSVVSGAITALSVPEVLSPDETLTFEWTPIGVAAVSAPRWRCLPTAGLTARSQSPLPLFPLPARATWTRTVMWTPLTWRSWPPISAGRIAMKANLARAISNPTVL